MILEVAHSMVGTASDYPRPGMGAGADGVLILGEHSVGKLLVLSQVVLSLHLPFAKYPLIKLTSRRHLGAAQERALDLVIAVMPVRDNSGSETLAGCSGIWVDLSRLLCEADT